MTSRIEKGVMDRLSGLLDMEYKPSEIAEELRTSIAVITDLIDMGCPSRVDTQERIWINGIAFSRWAREVTRWGKNDKP